MDFIQKCQEAMQLAKNYSLHKKFKLKILFDKDTWESFPDGERKTFGREFKKIISSNSSFIVHKRDYGKDRVQEYERIL